MGVDTKLFTPPDEYNINPPTCQYNMDTGDCFRECPPLLAGCESFCLKPEPPLYDEIPPVNTEFSDLLGEDVKVAEKFLKDTYGQDYLEIERVTEGDYVTKEIQTNRIRLWVDKG